MTVLMQVDESRSDGEPADVDRPPAVQWLFGYRSDA
jgi:hypothetical protein